MQLSRMTGIAVAALLVGAPVALAQTTSQTQSPTSKTGVTEATQTFTGCLMTESAYRAAHHLGAGAAGGLGLGDEFVITDVTVSPAKAASDTTSTSKPAISTTSSSSSAMTCADKGVAYRLTGQQEEKIKPMNIVGREIEVQGRFKHADDVTPSGAPTSGNLPAEVEIVSFREAPAPAPAGVSEPAPPVTPPTPPPATVAPRPTPPIPPEPATSTTPTTSEPKELPHTAGSSGLIALIGLFALGSGLAMAAWRRRVA